MAGILSSYQLPPGIAGYVAAGDVRDRRNAAGMNQVIGILNAENFMRQQAYEGQMQPLRVKQLEATVAEQDRMNQLLAQYQAMRRGALGAPGSSAPVGVLSGVNGGNAHVADPAGPGGAGAPVGVLSGGGPTAAPGLGLPPEVQIELLHPRLQALGKENAKLYAPTDRMREALALGFAPGSEAYRAHVGDVATQSGIWRTDPSGQRVLAPGYAEGRGAVQSAEEAAKAPFQIQERMIAGRPVTISNADYATLYGPDQLKAAQVAEKYAIPFNRIPVAGTPPVAVPAPAPVPMPPPSPVPAPAAAPGDSGIGRIPTANVVGRVPVNPTGAERAASETVAKHDADLVNVYRQKIPTMNVTLRRLDRLEALNLNDRTFAAAGAELKTQLGSIAQAFGLEVEKAKTANSEEYLAHVAELLKERLASKDYGSGTGVSNVDLLAARAPLPDLMRTQQGRAQIIQAVRADTQRAIRDASAAREYFDRNLSLRGFRYPSEMQEQPGGARTARRTGTYNGRRVVEYTDGTLEYEQ